VQDSKRRGRFSSRSGNEHPNVTAAVGLRETAGRLRARRSSLFTRTIIWVTGLICLAFLLGSLAQAWSNSQLIAQVQAEQVRAQQLQEYNKHLRQLADHYKDRFVIESEARQELGYVRPGEHAVVVISSNEQDKSSRSRVSHTPTVEGFWQEWWDVFFGS